MTLDENNLMRLFRAGEAGSFEVLYRDYGTRLYRFSQRLCGNDTVAEDLVQDVFVAAYQGAAQFEGRSSLATWLYRIALYRWRRIRNGRAPETVQLDEATAGTSPDPAPAELERIVLENALSALPDPLREAFLLVKGEGFLCREAAEILGIPEGTLKNRVYTAVVKLQLLLGPRETPVPAAMRRTGLLPEEILR